MIHIEIRKALNTQILFCKIRQRYRCGIFVTNKDKEAMIYNYLVNTLMKHKNTRNEQFSLIEFPNGSIIKIMQPNEYVRGQRYNGMIIDSDINDKIVKEIMLPILTSLTPYEFKDSSKTTKMIMDKPSNRVYYCSICENDFKIVEGENMIRGIKSRILLEDDVVKAVDKHTNEDGTLDNDISCILEEVNSVVLMGSKAAMSKLVNVKEPEYDFHVGDYVEDIEGNVGYIDFIYDCDRCKERRFNEPRIHYTSGETDYITVYQLENLEKSYRRIGKYEFSKKQPVIKSIDSIIVTGITEEGESFTMTFNDFDKDKVKIESINNNSGKKALSLTIRGGYSIKVEY